MRSCLRRLRVLDDSALTMSKLSHGIHIKTKISRGELPVMLTFKAYSSSNPFLT